MEMMSGQGRAPGWVPMMAMSDADADARTMLRRAGGSVDGAVKRAGDHDLTNVCICSTTGELTEKYRSFYTQ